MNATKAVFRRFADGMIIVLFYEDKNAVGEIKAYMMNGGFFYIDYGRVLHLTRPATATQRKATFFDLLSIGYDGIQIYQRARPQG
ncbi:MAG: hypothetical protein IJL04_01030 [Bacteroidales bacterium]|nr:hypothetical protein [Bacteroidales bacterium]MBQ6100856.1 hypothetical protein [Bacteroidales bacterium]